MGPLLAKLTQDDVTGSGPPSGSLDEIPAGKHIDPEAAMTRVSSLPEREHKDASPAGYGCPSCGGSLFQIDDGVVPRYRCRIGHAWSPETLLDEQAAALESALWVALRALEEKADLSHRLARRNLDLGNKHAAARFQALFDDSSRSASVVRDLIDRMGPPAA